MKIFPSLTLQEGKVWRRGNVENSRAGFKIMLVAVKYEIKFHLNFGIGSEAVEHVKTLSC